MKRKTILIIANLDTRGSEFMMVKELIESRGHKALFLDFSMEQEPFFRGDITCEEVATEGGIDIKDVRRLYRVERDRATENQIRGAKGIVHRLMEEGRVHGVIGIGGATTSMIATSVMRSLPLGMPKLMASSVAAHPKLVNKYVGTKDITMHNTVVDVVELNPILKTQLVNAIGAICGMVELSPGWKMDFKQPVVALTSYGLAERCIQPAVHYLREKGYIPIPCHAQGQGDRAMDEMIREGWFHGVIDFVPRGLSEELFDCGCAAGEDRLLAAAESGIPQVVAPSGLEMLSIDSSPENLAHYEDRPQFIADKLRIAVRTSADQLKQVAVIIADRLNRSRAPCAVLIPLRGWSSMDKEGSPLYDPDANRVFVEELKVRLNEEIPVKEVDLELNSPEFGKEAVDLFHNLFIQMESRADPICS